MSAPWPDWAYSGQPPAWAVEWGEGRDGVFVSFAVGEVVQRLRWIPPGEFQMGSPDGEPGRWDDEGPQRLVRLTRGFWLADTPVTQALWLAVMGDNPSRFQGDLRRPVEQVSWDDTQRFLERLRTEHGFAAELPTEAQWEYACRAGTTTRYWSGDAEADLARVGWYEGNSEGTTHPVGQKPANPWGLHDMHGNVWEWCADYWQDHYRGAQTEDPTGPVCVENVSEFRVRRGGSWSKTPRSTRSVSRAWRLQGLPYEFLGFRLARSEPAPET